MDAANRVGADAPSARVGAIVVAAGEGRRMGGVDKIFAPIMGQPLICYSIGTLNDSALVHDIVLVLSERNLQRGRRLVEARGWDKVRDVCLGGKLRQDSVRQGLERLADSEWVIVHDGARPLIDEDLIARGLDEARVTGSAIAAVPLTDTVKAVDSDLTVQETLLRQRLWAVQTPQIFRRQLLTDAHRRVSEPMTDDAAMVERTGGKVRIFMGSHRNIKITTLDGLTAAEALLRRRPISPWRGR